MKKLFSLHLRLLGLMMCFCTALWASAQGNTVTGTVIDENGEPMMGATVSVQGQAGLATATDLDGQFSLTLPKSEATLAITFIGYKETLQKVTGGGSYTIKMQPDENILDEVVVVGYGVQKKITMTGSVSAVGSKDPMKAPMQNVSNMLTGKISGMSSIQSNGQPGADGAAIYVRGVNGFGAQSPLVLVDGIERDMNMVNPGDIESVSVLKDAAASIYGIKGSNGVILITTKSGEGKTSINYNMSLSAVRNTAFPEFLNASEFMYYKNKALIMDGLEPLFSADIQQKVFANDPDSPWGETDWFDEIFRTGFTQQHNVSASGSTERVKYFTSLGYMSQDGTIKKTSFERFNARTNLEIKVARNLTFSTQLSGVKTQQEAPSSAAFGKQYEINPVRQAANTAPIIKKEWNGYKLAWKEGNAINVNPLAALENDGFYKRDNWIFNSSYKLEYDLSDLWEPLKGLKVSGFFAYDFTHTASREFTKGYELLAFDNYNLESKVEQSYGIGKEASFQRYANTSWRWMLRPAINYNRDFGKHSVNFLLLYEKTKAYSDMLYAAGRGYLATDPVDINLAPERTENVPLQQGNYQHTGMQSYVGRINYAYDNKYLFEFAMRRDGSYIFAPENRWANFPSVSVGWVASREKFLEDIQWIEMLKLRASYGESGSDNMDPFLYNLTYAMATNSYVINGAAMAQYYLSNSYAFRDFTWAHDKTFNFGVDFSLFRSKLSGEIDVFYKKTTDILEGTGGAYPPSLAGYFPSWANSGAADNRGVEITLNHQLAVTKDFNYRVRGSFSFARNKVLKKKVSDSYPNYRGQLGSPAYARYGFKTAGLFQTQEEIDNYPIAPSGETRLGDIKYVDVNGDGIISSAHDYVKIGYGMIPEINFSFNIDLNYKDFYLTTLWQGVTHCDYQLQGVYDNGVTASTVYTSAFGTGNSPKYLIEEAWTPENPDAKYPRLSTIPNGNNAWVSDWWTINGEYLRLKNIQLGYNIPANVLRKTPFSSVNVYVAGSNVLTFSHFKYVDPESPSVSNGFYPQQATYTFGLNVAF